MTSNVNFEYSIISTLLFDSRSFFHVQEHIAPNDFADEMTRSIFEIIETKVAVGEVVNEEVVMNALPNMADAIATRIVGVPPLDVKTVINFSKRVQEFSKKRKILKVFNDAMSDVKEDRPYDISELNSIMQGINHHMSNAEIIAIMEERLSNKVTSAPTGIANLDAFFSTSPGDTIVIAARPSMGKTSLVSTLIWSFIEAGEGSLFLSLEMPSDNIMLRMISSKSGEPISNIKHGRIVDIKKYNETKKFLRETDLFEMSDVSMDEGQIVHYVKQRFRMNPKLKHVFLDHLTFTRDSGKHKSEHLRINAITKDFKILAKELGLRFWELSQLSRSIESRPNKRPQLSDLRESGGIEENADVVLAIYNQSYYTAKESGERQPPVTEVELGVLKYRDGPPGTAHCFFNGPLVRFQNEGNVEMTEYVMDTPPVEMATIPDKAVVEANQRLGTDIPPHPNDYYPEAESDNYSVSNDEIPTVTMPIL